MKRDDLFEYEMLELRGFRKGFITGLLTAGGIASAIFAGYYFFDLSKDLEIHYNPTKNYVDTKIEINSDSNNHRELKKYSLY